MAASSGSLKVWFYKTDTGNVPCVISQGYSAYTSKTVNTTTTTEGSITYADIVLLGGEFTRLTGVAVGTTVGTIAVGN